MPWHTTDPGSVPATAYGMLPGISTEQSGLTPKPKGKKWALVVCYIGIGDIMLSKREKESSY